MFSFGIRRIAGFALVSLILGVFAVGGGFTETGVGSASDTAGGRVVLHAGQRSNATDADAIGWLAEDLVAYYAMNEPSGDALDSHTGGHTLAQVGVVGTAAGHVYPSARSFQYAGATGGAHFASGAPALRPAGDTTIAVWYRLTAMPTGSWPDLYRHIWGQCGWDGGMSLLANQAGELAFQTSLGGGNYATLHVPAPAPLLNAWHLAVFWYDSSSSSLYGQLDAGVVGRWPVQGSLPGPVLPGTDLTVIGAGDTAGREAWDGELGPVMAWNRLLAAEERGLLYNEGRGLTYHELVAQEPGATVTVTPGHTPTPTSEPTILPTQTATATAAPTATRTSVPAPSSTPTPARTLLPAISAASRAGVATTGGAPA